MTTHRTCSSCQTALCAVANGRISLTSQGRERFTCGSCIKLMVARRNGTYKRPPAERKFKGFPP